MDLVYLEPVTVPEVVEEELPAPGGKVLAQVAGNSVIDVVGSAVWRTPPGRRRRGRIII